MDHFPTNWGRPRNDTFDAYGTFPVHSRPQNLSSAGKQHTQQPIVTGTSVLGIKYKDGVMMAADNLASYGSLARFKDIKRLHATGSYTVVGAGGDMSDFQYIQRTLDSLIIDDFTAGDGRIIGPDGKERGVHDLGPKEIHEYLSQVMYARRTNMNPLWNSLLVGGFKDGERFLAYVDLLGTTYSSSTLATGYGAFIAQPLLRKAVEGREDVLDEATAKGILEGAMRVLYYRDARSLDSYQIATITKDGVTISDSQKLSTSWNFAEGIRGYGAQTQ